jgi:hypothetical protein
MADINRIAAPMGIPWERSKDIPFGTVIRYIGLEWDIARHTVALPHDKREKYRAAISNWTARITHTLDQVQSLYGKLLHACHIIPVGRAYLTRLEIFMGHWRAWRLTGDWQSEGRDIGWAEAVGFELLTRTLITLYGPDSNFKCFGHNTGVIERWRKGSSKNAQTNDVFRRIHDITHTTGAHFHTRYVPSQHNPADAPSRGWLRHPHRLLPPVPLPKPLQPYLRDATDPAAWPLGLNPPSKHHKQRRDGIFLTSQLERASEEVRTAAATWLDA